MFGFPCRRSRHYRICWNPKRMKWTLDACLQGSTSLHHIQGIALCSLVSQLPKDFSFAELAKKVLFPPTFKPLIGASELLVSPDGPNMVTEQGLTRTAIQEYIYCNSLFNHHG